MLLNPASNESILILSLLSSLISALISLTRTFTMRKANKIDSIIMLEEVKLKINHQRAIEPSVNKQAEKDNLQSILNNYDKTMLIETEKIESKSLFGGSKKVHPLSNSVTLQSKVKAKIS